MLPFEVTFEIAFLLTFSSNCLQLPFTFFKLTFESHLFIYHFQSQLVSDRLSSFLTVPFLSDFLKLPFEANV